MAAIDCNSTALIESAKCFQSCIPKGMQLAVQTMLLAQIAGDARSPSDLANAAACFSRCIPEGEQLAVQNYLLCQLVSVL